MPRKHKNERPGHMDVKALLVRLQAEQSERVKADKTEVEARRDGR